LRPRRSLVRIVFDTLHVLLLFHALDGVSQAGEGALGVLLVLHDRGDDLPVERLGGLAPDRRLVESGQLGGELGVDLADLLSPEVFLRLLERRVSYAGLYAG
jgi:hypothetical protein